MILIMISPRFYLFFVSALFHKDQGIQQTTNFEQTYIKKNIKKQGDINNGLNLYPKTSFVFNSNKTKTWRQVIILFLYSYSPKFHL